MLEFIVFSSKLVKCLNLGLVSRDILLILLLKRHLVPSIRESLAVEQGLVGPIRTEGLVKDHQIKLRVGSIVNLNPRDE